MLRARNHSVGGDTGVRMGAVERFVQAAIVVVQKM